MPADKTIDTVLLIISLSLLALGLFSAFIGWLLRTWDRLRGVNTSEEEGAEVMSFDEEESSTDRASSLQTRPDQTPDRPAAPAISRDVMLDTYRRLRKHGMAREEARTMLRALNLPLDNNLWSQAAPPPAASLTPIAQRPTEADFRDPDLEYEPLR